MMKRKFFYLSILISFFTLLSAHLFALDPVAPVSERKFGFLQVHSPLPESDICTVTNPTTGFSQTFKPGETIKIPVGEYSLNVKLQHNEWSSPAIIQPTERTDIFVTGYGNLKVTAANPTTTSIEVYSQDGRLITQFAPNGPQTLPTGTYNLKIKIGNSTAQQEGVVIITNTTREIMVSTEEVPVEKISKKNKKH